jgi:hypothetical protein
LFAGNGAQDSFNIPKDVQDRMTFDCQAASFFSYVLQKLGMEKAQEVVRWSRDGKPARELLARAEYLGTDLDQIEKDWIDWVKNQKADSPGNPRMTSGGPPGSSDPSHKP